jgi:hypothetical protein
MGRVVSVTPRLRFSPVERTAGTHCTGGWVGPLSAEARGKILSPLPGIEPRSPGRPAQPDTILTELPGSPYVTYACTYYRLSRATGDKCSRIQTSNFFGNIH